MSAGSERSDLVLHAVSSGGLYGIERMLLNLLPELGRQGCPVALLCLDGPETEVGRAARDLGVRTIFVDCARRLAPHGWVDLYRSIASISPRAVHVHGYKATILAGGAALAQRVPTVATYHNVAASAGEQSASMSWYLRLETPILRRFDGVVAVSDQIAAELKARGLPVGRVRVVFNGIADPKARRAAPPPGVHAAPFRPCILSVSRLVPGKNIGLVMDAVAALRAEYPDVGLVVAGDGPLLGALQARAASLGLAESVRFPGFVPDVGPLYGSCDAFVLVSRTEGMPIAVLEAMAWGIPVVASRVGGIPVMLDDGSDALIVEADDASGLREALRRILGDARLRSTLARSARERFERYFTAERMAQAYVQFYDEVAPRGRSADPGVHRR
jgi:glycosyltransferase involved in cell wall biosynthesis